MKHESTVTRKILAFILLIASSPVFAGAWVQPVGTSLLIAQYQYYRSCQFWNKQGHLKDGSCYVQNQINPYYEYGLTKDLTLGVSPYFRQVSQLGNSTGLQLGDMQLLGRYQFWHNDWNVASVQLTFNIPFAKPLLVNPLPPTVSLGQYSLDSRLLYGAGGYFERKYMSMWYANFEGAYRNNFNGAADEWHADMALGWKDPTQKLILEFKVYNTFSLHNPSGPMQPNYSLTTISPNVLYWMLKQIGLQAGVSYDIYGVNIGKGVAPYIALWWHN